MLITRPITNFNLLQPLHDVTAQLSLTQHLMQFVSRPSKRHKLRQQCHWKEKPSAQRLVEAWSWVPNSWWRVQLILFPMASSWIERRRAIDMPRCGGIWIGFRHSLIGILRDLGRCTLPILLCSMLSIHTILLSMSPWRQTAPPAGEEVHYSSQSLKGTDCRTVHDLTFIPCNYWRSICSSRSLDCHTIARPYRSVTTQQPGLIAIESGKTVGTPLWLFLQCAPW